MKTTKPAISLLLAFILFLGPFTWAATASQQGAIGDVMAREIKILIKECKKIDFKDDYLRVIDFNNDHLPDLITRPNRLSCDGIASPQCNLLGCPYRFYIQLSDGSYHLTAEIQMRSYRLKKYFGNMVLEMTLQAGYCKKPIGTECKETFRVRGARFVKVGGR